ncbi:MAG: MMPL family transporter, partial [Myxococcales bacterium]|nr:MMPL family transporter [Myxococcales bacterium]
EAWRRLRAYALANPLYQNLLISSDARLSLVTIETSAYSSEGLGAEDPIEFTEDEESGAPLAFLTGAENRAAVQAMRQVADRFAGEGFEISLAGAPVLQAEVIGMMERDMVRFVGMMVGVIALLLSVLFRRVSGVLLPLLVVAPAASGTIGIMVIAGEQMSAVHQILPSMLLAVGVGAAVHILTIFFQHFDAGESREDAIAQALGHSGLAVCMASLTTAGGLLSFVAAKAAPVAAIGTFAPIGILLALVYCLVLLPAFVSVLPLRRKSRAGREAGTAPDSGRLGNALVAVGEFSIRHARAAVGITVLVVAVSLVGASKIHFGHDIMSWLPAAHPLHAVTALFDAELQGSMSLEVVADTGQENGVQRVEALKALDALPAELRELARARGLDVGKTISVADVVKEINQALNDGSADFHRIPQDRRLIAQELLLFESSGTDALETMVDSRFSMARMSIRLPYVDPMRYPPFIEESVARFEAHFGPGVAIHATGFAAVMSTTIRALISSLASSYVLALLIITPLMMLLLGSLRIGLASMIPNLAPILITLGIMGWGGITMDAFTLMIGGIAIGLAVDDTIHYLHNFRRYYEESGDVSQASAETLRTTGQALFVTSVVLTAGFAIFTLAELTNLFYFGLLTALTIANAFLIDILVSPALMALAYGGKHRDTARSAPGG